MHAHEFFGDLLVHDDDELGDLLGCPVAARTLRHEWPLSRLEDVRLRDGRRYAYKAQLPPTVEPGFYAVARTHLLVPHLALGAAGRTTFLATEWLDVPALSGLGLGHEEFLDHARRVIRETAGIAGSPPVFLDLSTPEALAAAADETATRLAALIADGRFSMLHADVPGRVAAWARDPQVLDAATTAPGIVHGDLSGDEVLLADDGYRVLDWQRPVLGPREMDLVSLLLHAGADPRQIVARPVVQLSRFVLLHWAALAQHDLLPGLSPEFTGGWAVTALDDILG
jgi:hypothetical protein